MTEPKYLIFDCESTGIDTENDRIVQLVIATADADGNLIANREWLIDPGVPIPEGATEVHGLTNAYLEENGYTPYDALREARTFFGSYLGLTWIAYNLNYDASILSSEMHRHHVDYEFDRLFSRGRVNLFDPLVVDRARDKYRKGKRKLINVAEHYGIPLDADRLHNALYDVEVTAKVAAAVAKKYGIPSTDEQAQMYEAWAKNLQEYFRKTDPDAKVNRGWPLQTKEEHA